MNKDENKFNDCVEVLTLSVTKASPACYLHCSHKEASDTRHLCNLRQRGRFQAKPRAPISTHSASIKIDVDPNAARTPGLNSDYQGFGRKSHSYSRA